MEILQRDTLPLGGFAGLREHRPVKDTRVFGRQRNPGTWEGIGNFVYLADARFLPRGETHLHSHREIDVISVMVEGRTAHEGPLQHGQELGGKDLTFTASTTTQLTLVHLAQPAETGTGSRGI